MKISYICDRCTAPIAEIEMAELDENRLGFAALTEEEKKDIIRVDMETGTMLVYAICDDCIAALGLDEAGTAARPYYGLH